MAISSRGNAMNKKKLRKWADKLCDTTWCNPQTHPSPDIVRNVENELRAILEKDRKQREGTLLKLEAIAKRWPELVIHLQKGKWIVHEKLKDGTFAGKSAEGSSFQEAVSAAYGEI
jgi:hypothetical protein